MECAQQKFAMEMTYERSFLLSLIKKWPNKYIPETAFFRDKYGCVVDRGELLSMLQFRESSQAKNEGAYFLAVRGSIIDPIVVLGQYEVARV